MKEWLVRAMTAGAAPRGWPRYLAVVGAGLAAVAIVGYLDFRNAHDFRLGVFFFLPILLVTLQLDRRAGMLIAAASAGTWFLSGVLLAPGGSAGRELLWSTGIRFGMYTVVVLLLAELKGAILAERRQRRTLEELDALKNQLLGVAAHDLRSPVAVVKMHAELLRDSLGAGADENQRKSIAAIVGKSAFMLRLIGDVLDFSRIDSGQLALSARVGDYAGFVEDQVALLGRLGAARGNPVALEAAEALPELAFDPDRMEQVLSNLVGNALKFSPPGAGVTVRIACEGTEVVTRVVDRGPGIPPEERRRIFDPFVRGSVQPQGAAKGTGLGLAISGKIVKAHGGRIGVEETPGGGATFRFSLPLPPRE